MTFRELKKLVVAEYDRRKLSSNVRYKSLDDFENMLRVAFPELISDVLKFPSDKEIMKKAYEKYRNNKGLKMSCAASSMINEIYNQLQNTHSICGNR